jgi:Tol biopolymer transport system component
VPRVSGSILGPYDQRAPRHGGALLLAAAIVACGCGAGIPPATSRAARPLTRLSVDLGPEAVRGRSVTAVISPDGTRLVFKGRSAEADVPQLFLRHLDQREAMPIPGTAHPFLESVFFSPDGAWIGFLGNSQIMKVSAQVTGVAAVVVGDVPPDSQGASWGDDGNILVGSYGGLMRIPASGGAATPLAPNAGTQLFPHVLPGSRAVLFNAASAGAFRSLDDLQVAVHLFESGDTKTLVSGGYWPHYLPTSPTTGHLVFMRGGTLFGVPFDPLRLEIRGTPAPLLDDVAASVNMLELGGQFSFSTTGTFVYLSGTADNSAYPMVWLEASGRTTPLNAEPGAYGAPRVSPDGTRLAFTKEGVTGADVWVYDVARQTSRQLTATAPGFRELAWAPDSRHVIYGDGRSLWWIADGGSAPPQRLLERANNPRPFSVRADGRLAFSPHTDVFPNVWTLPLDLRDPEHPQPGAPEPFLDDPFVVEVDPAFSPDGRFLAYASSESGPEEVFVRAFPGPGGKWKISNAGGKFPVWSRAARTLYFLGGDDQIMVVDYTFNGGAFTAGWPRPWSPAFIVRDGLRQSFDMTPDGLRAIVSQRPAAEPVEGSLHATFLLDFFDEVRRRIP